MHELQDVGFRLCLDTDTDTGSPVGTEQRAIILSLETDLGDFAETNEMSFQSFAYDQIAKIIFIIEPDFGAQRELTLDRFDAARRKLDIFTTQSGLDVIDGK